MKKTILYIAIVLLLMVITSAGTYAYFVATTNTQTNILNPNATNLEFVYTKGDKIEGLLSLTEDKEGGLSTTVKVRLTEDSVVVPVNLYINIEQISEYLATEGLNWEVYKKTSSGETLVNSGTFANCGTVAEPKQCASGDRLYVVNNYDVTTTDTSFTVYIWLNGHKVGNEVMGAIFKGTIGADSDPFTSELG